jgi:hypothetical protein
VVGAGSSGDGMRPACCPLVQRLIYRNTYCLIDNVWVLS